MPVMPGSVKARLSAAMLEGLGRAGKGSTRPAAQAAAQKLTDLGITGVSYASTDEELAEWEHRLWHEQDDPIEERQKEWRQIMHYAANEQFLAYHRGRREWIERKTVPWRIRASYNIIGKAVELRTQRLTENKPAISVQAATVDRGDVDKAEYKETLFWALWEKLSLHTRIVDARHWATLCGAGFLKIGWDPDAGVEVPVTQKRLRYETVQVPATDPAGAPLVGPDGPVMASKQVYAGIEEYYVDRNGNDLGPVEGMVPDEDNPGQQKKVRLPVPEGADAYHEGEVYVEDRSSFNIRWDRYADDPDESWYVQDAQILSGSKVVAMFPDAAEKLGEARSASHEERAHFWTALQERHATWDHTVNHHGHNGQPVGDATGLQGALDKDYLVRETWIFPKNPFLAKLWGKEGTYLITVGGVLLSKSSLPKWALKKCPFIRFLDLPEKGNHYGKPHMRDLLPLQDDINRARSMMAERLAIESRLILGAPQNHGINIRLMGGMPGVLLTYRSRDHQPTPIQLTQQGQGAEGFYKSSLDAAADLGNMNDASTGKLPAAGIPAKAIYALQYADDRSIKKTATLQDESLKKLAMAIDAVTRVEYREARKVRITGQDRSFLIETELLPDQLDTDVDYFFQPGSMLQIQKETVRNEMLALRDARLIDDQTVKKFLPTAVPDVFRLSNDLHEAKARRNLSKILRDGVRNLQPDPFDVAAVHVQVLESCMLTQRWDVLGEGEKQAITELWQAYQQMAAQQAAPPPPAPAPGTPDATYQQFVADVQNKAMSAASSMIAKEVSAATAEAAAQPAPLGGTPGAGAPPGVVEAGGPAGVGGEGQGAPAGPPVSPPPGQQLGAPAPPPGIADGATALERLATAAMAPGAESEEP